MRKINLLLLTVLLTSVLSIQVNAQGEQMKTEKVKIGNTILKATSDSADDPLSYCSDSICDSDDYLVLYCSTYSNKTCDELKLEIYLQEKINGSWSTIETYTYTEYNTSTISKTPTYSSKKSGSKYRIKTFHYATINDENYVKITTSPSITAK